MSQQQEHRAPTRQAVLVAHAEQMRLRTGLSHEEWAERVDFQYCARVAPKHRAVPAPDLNQITGADEWKKLRRAWDQTIRRYVSGELRFPVELEEAWVEALDEPYRSDCIRELAQRYGLLGAFTEELGPAGDHRSWGRTVEDFGSLTQTIGRMLENGRFGPEDAPTLPELVRWVRRMRADLQALEAQAERAVSAGSHLREVQ